MSGPRFKALEYFRHDVGYQLLPFRFTRFGSDVLIVSDVGEYQFLAPSSFAAFVERRLPPSATEYETLKSKHFLTDSDTPVPRELLATQYRTRKSFLDGFTALHMFVVTLRCDHSCGYCQVSRVTESRNAFDMSVATADKAVALMLRSPAPALKVEFQGGESLLNFELVRYIVERVEERAKADGRSVEFVVATNLAPLSDEILAFLAEHAVLVSTSLDGPPFIHDANRPRRGTSSYGLVRANIARARSALGHDRVSALMTATPLSLAHPREIIDEYAELEFDSIFLRWISPYGFALRTGMAGGYGVEEFLRFYETGLDYIIELNRRGTNLVEVYSQILLRRILTPFPTGYVDLQSPAGAVLNAVAYNYDGFVYASDEARMLAEMGDQTFALGHLDTASYEEMFGGPTARLLASTSVVETLPGCSWCAFAPYCGADPIFHWATQRDVIGHRPSSAFCGRNMGVFRHLFERIRRADPFEQALFAQWASQN